MPHKPGRLLWRFSALTWGAAAMSRLTFVAAPVTLLLLFAPAMSDQGATWAGKTVATKKPGVKLQVKSATGETTTHTATQVVYTVLAEKDGLLQVRAGAIEGWFPKDQAVLTANALDFFTEQIDAKPKN